MSNMSASEVFSLVDGKNTTGVAQCQDHLRHKCRSRCSNQMQLAQGHDLHLGGV